MTGAERIAVRSRAVTLGGLAILAALAWAYLLTGAGMGRAMDGGDMAGMAMDRPDFTILLAMWWVMMIAMMLPSAAPVILLYATVHRTRIGHDVPPPTAAFLLGYLACWLGFSLLAAASQMWLESAALASPMTMAIESRTAAAGLLVAAGLYQITPLKDACLRSCRGPADFLTRHYRPGASGAFRLGLIHGAFCVGCCWMLMALLFVGGVMNLLWIAGLTLLVAAEKLLAGGQWIARLAGGAMIAAGAVLLLA